MPTILVGGYYGAGNVGDEAILVAMVAELRAASPDPAALDFIVLSWDPPRTSRELAVEAIHWKDINALLAAARRADLVIVGGGGIFHDMWGIDPDTYLRKGAWDITAFGSLPLLAKLLGIPCMIYGVGIGPFHADLARQHTRLAFERAQVATVRDDESLALLRGCGFDPSAPSAPILRVLPDPVFTLQTSPEDEASVAAFLEQRGVDPAVPLLGISLHYWDRPTPPDQWLPDVAAGVRRFLDSNPALQAIAIPFQVLEATPFTNDALVLQQLAGHVDLPGRLHLVSEPLTVLFVQALIKRCSLVLTMRLHGIIMGINVGTPAVALASRPKIASAMRIAGLEALCNDSLAPGAEALSSRLQQAWDQRTELSSRLLDLSRRLRHQAAEHARLALGLLSRPRPADLDFSTGFALEQVRLLQAADEAHELQEREKAELNSSKYALQERIWALESKLQDQDIELRQLQARLAEIESTTFWKLALKYYHLMSNTVLRFPYFFLVTLRREGFRSAFRKLRELRRAPMAQVDLFGVEAREAMRLLLEKVNARPHKGVFVVTSAFVFDELYNQRVINLSKFLARQGWVVIYVAWVWYSAWEAPVGEVYPNVFQVPSNQFLSSYAALENLQAGTRCFVAEFPHPEFLAAAVSLKSRGFTILYEIIDNWEEFHKVGQANWYRKAVEESFVLNANCLTAVSQPLVDKFSGIRHDFHLIPNGFDPAFLGEHQNASLGHPRGAALQLGYFGHLTDSWFDWSFLLETLDLAEKHGLPLQLHLIGYGEPAGLKQRLEKFGGRVRFYGKVPPAELHSYAREWDVAMIPFKSGRLSEAVDPIKIYEYRYFGLPVIVKGITHLRDLPGVTVVATPEEFVEALARLRQEGPPAQPPAGLLEYTWERRFTRLLGILEDRQWMSL